MSQRHIIAIPSRDAEIFPADEGHEEKHMETSPHLFSTNEKAKAYANYFVRNIKIFIVCCFSYVVLVVVVTLAVLRLSRGYEAESQEMVRTGVAAEIEYTAHIEFSGLANKLMAVGLTALSIANCTSIIQAFPTIAQAALHGNNNPVRFYFDAAGETVSSYPEVSFDGRYLSNHSFIESKDEEYLAVMTRQEATFGLPFRHEDGYQASYIYYPLWARSPDFTDCEIYYDCTDPSCWNDEEGKKFMGMVRALVNLDYILARFSPTFRSLSRKYDYCLYFKLSYLSDPFKRLYCSNHKPLEAVSRWFEVYGMVVRLDITNSNRWAERFHDPWAPEWKYRLTFSLYIFTFPFMVLLYWALVSRKKYTKLLSSILPSRVIDHLALHSGVFSEEFQNVTILFSDICNFTPIASSLTPIQIVGMLDELYSMYDKLAKKHGVYKVETIGDAYMVSCGCPDALDPQAAALRMIAMAKDMIMTVNSFHPSYLPPDIPFRVRVGINSGGVVAGVVGRTMPRYCLFGDVVNTASRMESTCEQMKIQISESTFKLIDGCGVPVTPRGVVSVKGKGSMQTYYVDIDLNTAEDNIVSAFEAPVRLMRGGSRNVAFSWIPRPPHEGDIDEGSSLAGLWSSLTSVRPKTRTIEVQESPRNIESILRQGIRSLSDSPLRKRFSTTSSADNTPAPTSGTEAVPAHGTASDQQEY